MICLGLHQTVLGSRKLMWKTEQASQPTTSGSDGLEHSPGRFLLVVHVSLATRECQSWWEMVPSTPLEPLSCGFAWTQIGCVRANRRGQLSVLQRYITKPIVSPSHKVFLSYLTNVCKELDVRSERIARSSGTYCTTPGDPHHGREAGLPWL